MRFRIAFALTGAAFALGGCATVHNLPLNKPSANPFAGTLIQAAQAAERKGDTGGTVVGLAFSGGGTRAAAFAYGVLKQLERTPTPHVGGRDLLDHVGIVSGRLGRLDHRRLLRTEGPRRARRFPPAVPHPGR